jgi:hypothetical protein
VPQIVHCPLSRDQKYRLFLFLPTESLPDQLRGPRDRAHQISETQQVDDHDVAVSGRFDETLKKTLKIGSVPQGQLTHQRSEDQTDHSADDHVERESRGEVVGVLLGNDRREGRLDETPQKSHGGHGHQLPVEVVPRDESRPADDQEERGGEEEVATFDSEEGVDHRKEDSGGEIRGEEDRDEESGLVGVVTRVDEDQRDDGDESDVGGESQSQPQRYVEVHRVLEHTQVHGDDQRLPKALVGLVQRRDRQSSVSHAHNRGPGFRHDVILLLDEEFLFVHPHLLLLHVPLDGLESDGCQHRVETQSRYHGDGSSEP